MSQQHPKEERTFVIIKPDGVRKGLIGEIIHRFEQRDMKIVAMEMFMPTREEMDNHYPKTEAWLKRLGTKTEDTYKRYNRDVMADFGTTDLLKMGEEVRSWLISYMISAPMVRMVVEGVHSIDMIRKITGPTMPYLAEMGTIRGDFSADSPILANVEKRAVMNLIHASETPEEAAHEIEHWFGGKPIFKYKRFGIDE